MIKGRTLWFKVLCLGVKFTCSSSLSIWLDVELPGTFVSMFMKQVFPERISWEGKAYFEYGWDCPMGREPGWNERVGREDKRNSGVSFSSAAGSVCHDVNWDALVCPPTVMDRILWAHKQNKSFLLGLLSLTDSLIHPKVIWEKPQLRDCLNQIGLWTHWGMSQLLIRRV